jgi:polyisoprenoid-binding protein YceI
MTTTTIPGYLVGTWDIDPVHSDVSFSVRHMMMSKIKGRFSTFSGTVVTAENPLESSVTAEIDMASIDTNNEQRDGHVKSSDFFDVENNPKMTYKSTSISGSGDSYTLEGDLTIKGVTKPVPLKLELGGFGVDSFGGTRGGFSATTEISRSDFGISFSMPLDGGGVVIGDKITITLDIEAVLRTA